jgi:hypothetical protein
MATFAVVLVVEGDTLDEAMAWPVCEPAVYMSQPWCVDPVDTGFDVPEFTALSILSQHPARKAIGKLMEGS